MIRCIISTFCKLLLECCSLVNETLHFDELLTRDQVLPFCLIGYESTGILFYFGANRFFFFYFFPSFYMVSEVFDI